MSTDESPQPNLAKVRIGLAMITVVVVAAIVLVFVVEAAAGKAVMFAIATLGVVRAYLLMRDLRREQSG